MGDTDTIVTDYKSGILVNNFTVEDYKNAAELMNYSFDENEIINGATQYFSLENGIEKYAKVYQSVLN